MCFQYVCVVCAILICSLIISATAINVEEGRVIDIDKNFSYQYKVVTPDGKDITNAETTQHTRSQEGLQDEKRTATQPKSQHQEQSLSDGLYVQVITKVTEYQLYTPQEQEHELQLQGQRHVQTRFQLQERKLRQDEAQIQDKTQVQEQASLPRRSFMPRQFQNQEQPEVQQFSEIRENPSSLKQLQINVNSRKQESPDIYFRSQRQENPQQYEQMRLQYQPNVQDEFQNNENLQMRAQSNPHFYSVNKRLTVEKPQRQQKRKHIQFQERDDTSEQIQIPEHSQLQLKNVHSNEHLPTTRNLNRYFNQIKKQALREQAPVDNQSEEYEQPGKQEQPQTNVDSGTHGKLNSHFYSVNKRLVHSQPQSEPPSVKYIETQEQERSQENEQAQEQSQEEEEHLVTTEEQHLYKSAKRHQLLQHNQMQEQKSENFERFEGQPQLQMQQRLQSNENLQSQQTSRPHFYSVNNRLPKKQITSEEHIPIQDQDQSHEQQQSQENEETKMEEPLQSHSHVRSTVKANTNFKSVKKHKQRSTQKQLDEVTLSRMQQQSQTYKQFQYNENSETSKTSKPHFYSVNKRLVSLQSLAPPDQLNENIRSQEQRQEQSKKHKHSRIQRLRQEHQHLPPPDTPNKYYDAVNKLNLNKEISMQKIPKQHERITEQPQNEDSILITESSKLLIYTDDTRIKKEQQDQQQPPDRFKSQEYVQLEENQPAQIGEQSQMHKINQVNEDSPPIAQPKQHFQYAQKQPNEQKQAMSAIHEQTPIQEQPQIEERLLYQPQPDKHESSRPYVNDENLLLSNQPELREWLNINPQSNEHQQSRNQQNSFVDKHAHIHEFSQEHAQAQMQGILEYQNSVKLERTSNPNFSYITTRLIDQHSRSPIKLSIPELSQAIVQSQIKELPRTAVQMMQDELSVRERLRNQETQGPDIKYASIYPLHEPLQMQNQSQIHDQTQVKTENQAVVQEKPQINEQQRLQQWSPTYDEKTPKPHFYSVNKRLPDINSKEAKENPKHIQTQEKLYSYLPPVHKLMNIEEKSDVLRQLSAQERFRLTEEQAKIHEYEQRLPTTNRYFQSINKRLVEEQIGRLEHKSGLDLNPANKRSTTAKHLQILELPATQQTKNRYFHSVNKRFTEYQSQISQIQKHKHIQENKDVQVTTNRYFHSVNKRLTTEDHMNERDRSDYDDYAKDWFETASTSSQKYRYQKHHDIYTVAQYNEYHEKEKNNEQSSEDEHGIKNTAFIDLTARKRKHKKNHKHTHHKETQSNEHTHLHTSDIYSGHSKHGNKHIFKGSKFLRENKIHNVSDDRYTDTTTLKDYTETIENIKQQFTSTIENKNSFKEPQTAETFLNLFTIKDNKLNRFRIEANSTKLKRQHKPAQQSINLLKANFTNNTVNNKMDTQIINNLTFNEIYSHPQKIKHDTQINTFTSHILQSGLNVFAVLKEKATDYGIKNQIDALADRYVTKYKEFLADTCRHEIKTSLGKQKVILNAIDVSDRILKRLFNFIVADMDEKGNLRENIGTAIDFQQEVAKEITLQYNHACKKFGICRTGNGFPEFLTEFLTTVLRCERSKFKLAIDSLTEVTKNIDFSDIFPKRTCRMIKSTVDRVELREINALRPSLMIIKNIIANKNKPLVVSKVESNSGRVNATLALLEIVNILDETLPRTDANIIDWGDLRTNLDDWAQNKRPDVTETMGNFMKYIKSALQKLPFEVREHIADNFERIINIY